MAEPRALAPSSLRALVFDLDGTLVDSYGPIAESLNHARACHGLPALPHDEVRRGVGRGLECLIAQFVGPDRVVEGVLRFRERYAQVFREGTSALPGVPETLEALHAGGYRMAVASNKPARFSTPILEQLGLLDFFDCVLGPDLVEHAKPHPAMIGECLRRLAAAADQAAYVGDMELDVESAARSGVPVLLIPSGSSPREALRATGERVLDSFAELLSLLPPLRATT